MEIRGEGGREILGRSIFLSMSYGTSCKHSSSLPGGVLQLESIINNHCYPRLLTAIEKQSSRCNALQYLEYSGTKVIMNGSIACKVHVG